MMSDDRLHEIDLVQIERIKKLAVRLNRDLATLDRYTAAMAYQESQEAFEEMGLPVAPDALQGKEGEVVSRDSLAQDQVKVLQALKKGVWDTGRALVVDSKRWKAQVEKSNKAEDNERT